jgi:two-component system invasion response regulator UvrY
MYNFLIVDDHEMTRYGTNLLLATHFKPCEINEASDGAEVIELVKKKAYDLILLDMNMPNTDSQQLVSAIKVISPDAKIIIFSMNKEEIFARMFLSLSVKGYVEKAVDKEELIYAIQTVLRGHIYLSESMKSDIVTNKKELVFKNPFNALSNKELEVLNHIVKGFGINDTAKIMSLSSSTIATHKARILSKLHLKTIHELIDLAKLHNMS